LVVFRGSSGKRRSPASQSSSLRYLFTGALESEDLPFDAEDSEAEELDELPSELPL
jgi:hypothetical protein